MEKEFVLVEDKYSAEKVADIILDMVYQVDHEKLCKKFSNISVSFRDKHGKRIMFY